MQAEIGENNTSHDGHSTLLNKTSKLEDDIDGLFITTDKKT